MAVVKVTEHFDGRGSTETQNSEKTFRRVFTVHSDVMDEKVELIRRATDLLGTGIIIPLVGDEHPEDSDSLCIRVEPSQRTDSPWLWTVTADYSSFADPDFADPIARRPRVTFGQIETQRAMERADRLKADDPAGADPLQVAEADSPVVNSAGDPFDPPVMADRYLTVLTVRRNERVYPRALRKQFVGKINRTPWYSFPAFTVKCVAITADEPKTENGVFYWPCTYVFHIADGDDALDKTAWLTCLIDVGMNELDPAGVKRRIRAKTDGGQFGSQTPLDGTGQALADVDLKARAFKYRIFCQPKRVDFAGLNMDNLPL